MTSIPRNIGDDDIPDLDHDEMFYQAVMAELQTGKVVLSKFQSLIDDFEAIELPTLKPEKKV